VLYALEPSAWGKGYATEAAGASLEIGFSELLLQHIVAGALAGNRGSMHVMEKLGMQRWETREFDDIEVIMYRITRAGWRAGRA